MNEEIRHEARAVGRTHTTLKESLTAEILRLVDLHKPDQEFRMKLPDVVHLISEQAVRLDDLKMEVPSVEFYRNEHRSVDKRGELVRIFYGDVNLGVCFEILGVVGMPYLKCFRHLNMRSRQMSYGADLNDAPIAIEDCLLWLVSRRKGGA